MMQHLLKINGINKEMKEEKLLMQIKVIKKCSANKTVKYLNFFKYCFIGTYISEEEIVR